jgi:hypothetical protein
MKLGFKSNSRESFKSTSSFGVIAQMWLAFFPELLQSKHPNFLSGLMDCEVSIMGIWSVLSQEEWPFESCSEKLNEARQKWTTYELKFYVVI